MAVAVKPTLCPNCGKTTDTIRGRCPNCAFLKNPDAAPPVKARRVPTGSIWDDANGVLMVGLWLAPTAVLLVLGAVLSLDVLFVIGAVVLLAPVAFRAFIEWL